MVSLKQSDGKEVYIGLCCKPTLEIEKFNQDYRISNDDILQ